MESRLNNIMAKVFNVPVDAIKSDSTPYTIVNWDSLTHVDLVLALQKEFEIRFSDDEIPTLVNYDIILNTIIAYKE